jgi:UDP-N-acetylmuramyl tripeptide synthase
MERDPMTRQPLLPLEVSAQASNALAWLRTHAPENAQLTGDTRRLQPGDVFFAYVLGNERLATDGRPHIDKAIAAGASAVSTRLTTSHGLTIACRIWQCLTCTNWQAPSRLAGTASPRAI